MTKWRRASSRKEKVSKLTDGNSEKQIPGDQPPERSSTSYSQNIAIIATLVLVPAIIIFGWIIDGLIESRWGGLPDADSNNPVIRHLLLLELARKGCTYGVAILLLCWPRRGTGGTGKWKLASRMFVILLILEYLGRFLAGCGAEGGDIPTLFGGVPVLGPLFFNAPLIGLVIWYLADKGFGRERK